MAKFEPGNKEWKKGIEAPPKEQSESVRKRRILSWMEFTTLRPRKTIDTFFARNGLKFEQPDISTYIAACKLSKGRNILLSDLKNIDPTLINK